MFLKILWNKSAYNHVIPSNETSKTFNIQTIARDNDETTNKLLIREMTFRSWNEACWREVRKISLSESLRTVSYFYFTPNANFFQLS